MVGLLAQFVEDFKKGRDEAYAVRGFRQGDRPSPETDATETRAEAEGGADDNALMTKLAETVKTLQKSNAELETERDEAKKLLTDVAAQAQSHKQRIEELDRQLAEQNKLNKKLKPDLTGKAKLIEKLAAQLKAVQAHAAELEGERDTLAAPYKIRGMKRVMQLLVHEDAHKERNLTEHQRRELTEWAQAVNVAFAVIKRLAVTPEATDE
jgi:uncharacterized coiled-coil protein SlyX